MPLMMRESAIILQLECEMSLYQCKIPNFYAGSHLDCCIIAVVLCLIVYTWFFK